MAVDRMTETITRKPGALQGQPHIVGTEITVANVLDLLADGIFPQEIVYGQTLSQSQPGPGLYLYCFCRSNIAIHQVGLRVLWSDSRILGNL